MDLLEEFNRVELIPGLPVERPCDSEDDGA